MSKNKENAFRALTILTASGLVCEIFILFGGRAGERKIIEFLGSLGPESADVKSWEDIATRDPWKTEDDVFGLRSKTLCLLESMNIFSLR